MICDGERQRVEREDLVKGRSNLQYIESISINILQNIEVFFWYFPCLKHVKAVLNSLSTFRCSC